MQRDGERFSQIITWRLHHVHGRPVNVPSPIDCESPKEQSILDEDEVVAEITLDVGADQVTLVPVGEIFER